MKQATLFFVSGFIGTVLFYILYEFLHGILPEVPGRAGWCWFLSYFCSIAWQHKLHCVIVFPNVMIKNYWASLFKTYLVYGGSLILSTIMNVALDSLGVQYQVAWVTTLLATGIINYYIVSGYAITSN